MTEQIKHYCSGGKGSNLHCQAALNDTEACCLSMTLKSVPWDPNPEEQALFSTILASGNPYKENKEGFVCLGEKGLSQLRPLINDKNEWHILGKESAMFYQIQCSGAQALARQVAAVVLSAILMAFY